MILAQDLRTQNNTKVIHQILMAEDNPADAELVKEMLLEAFGVSYKIHWVEKFKEVFFALENSDYEVLILDMSLPDSSGIKNVKDIRGRYPKLPIVVLTGNDDLELAADTIKEGAQDYLSKSSITPQLLSRSLYYSQERKKVEIKLRQALALAADKNAQLEKLVLYDVLTQLPNRAYLHREGRRMLHRAKRHGKELALMFFDLNGFKKVNDTFGHLVGDLLLKEVAIRLSNEVRDTDLLVRLAGDEFVAMSDLLDSRNDMIPLLERLIGAFNKPFEIQSHQIMMKPAIGVAFYPDADDLELLIKNADCAMYEAKGNDLDDKVQFFSESMSHKYSRNNRIEQQLGKAVAHDEFYVVFQPVRHFHESQVSVEALIRWESPLLGTVPPDEFISLAEGSPIINDITRLVVKQSADLFHRLLSRGYTLSAININVCASQLEHPHFSDLLIDWLTEYQLPFKKVCLELTERQIWHEGFPTTQLHQLRDHGIMIALDDYGTGYSSLTHLIDLSIDVIKLDRILIKDIDQRPQYQAIAAGIVEMAQKLGLTVVAEGIEREQELNTIESIGVNAAQGYFLYRPLSLEQVIAALNGLPK